MFDSLLCFKEGGEKKGSQHWICWANHHPCLFHWKINHSWESSTPKINAFLKTPASVHSQPFLSFPSWLKFLFLWDLTTLPQGSHPLTFFSLSDTGSHNCSHSHQLYSPTFLSRHSPSATVLVVCVVSPPFSLCFIYPPFLSLSLSLFNFRWECCQL